MYIGVDVGGTFTDLALNLGNGRKVILHKLPSTPSHPEEAIISGIEHIISQHDLDAADVLRVAHGTTVGTNALIQRQCGKVALVTSTGFRDLLEIGRQTRPRVYDMHSDYPKPLVDRHLRFEVPQRRLADGSIHVPLNEDAVRALGPKLKSENVDCVIVCFLHSYAFADDERRAAELLREATGGDVIVIASSSVYPEFREFERFSTAVLNGALMTIVGSYLDRLTGGIAGMGIIPEVKVSQSSGGLMSVKTARELPIRASLSGPAAGVQGAAVRATAAGYSSIITLDVGGTSADVSLLLNGKATIVNERDLAGFPIRLPSLDVNAVGAGGGSIAWIDNGDFLKVGPHSAGAVPGPACYDLGGTDATVTDANVYLRRLNDESLLDGTMPIRKDLSEAVISSLAHRLSLTIEDVALGITKLASATMVKAIRAISVERGHDPREFALFVYGGAGTLHARDVALDLGIGTVIIPPHPGILCAEGAMNSPLTMEFVRTLLTILSADCLDEIETIRNRLTQQVQAWFTHEGVAPEQQETKWTVGMRYVGQNYELALPFQGGKLDSGGIARLADAFHKDHEFNYGFASPDQPIQIVNLIATAVASLDVPDLPLAAHGDEISINEFRDVLFSGTTRHKSPVFRRESLVAGQQVNGPAVIEQLDTTTVVFPGDSCSIDRWGNLIMSIEE